MAIVIGKRYTFDTTEFPNTVAKCDTLIAHMAWCMANDTKTYRKVESYYRDIHDHRAEVADPAHSGAAVKRQISKGRPDAPAVYDKAHISENWE